MRGAALFLAAFLSGCGSATDETPATPVEPATPPTVAGPAELDPITGLKMTGDWQLVRNNCIGCHSAALVTQQRGDAGQWLGMIRWMQAKQNLWTFDPDTESRIVAYLAENYPPAPNRRRAALSSDLMPTNPYSPPSAQTER
ncbi:MAG: hypothetical protein QNJ05_11455 [Woeseiaceae bacterium]|nr:hypothetical protein [Woeseiaceae bacterium]